MTQDISSLMDGELAPHEAERAIRAVCTSREAAHTWQTYHLIGEVLRGDMPHPTSTAQRVLKALESEPAIIARPRRILETSFGRVALAAAASVATIGVVGWIGTQSGQVPDGTGTVVARSSTATRPVSNLVPVSPAPDIQDYFVAHRQLPSADLYRPAVNQRRAVPANAVR